MDKKVSKSKVKYFFKISLIVISILVSLAVLVFALLVLGVVDITKNIDMTGDSLQFTTFVYYTNDVGDEIIYEPISGTQNRKKVDLLQIPANLQQAIIAIEDERFYQHIGVDFKSTSKAVFDYVFKRPGGRGASTLTQQLIKNITGNNKVLVSRKVTEILQAIAIERKYTKDQILELYLNTIYLSQGCYGVGAASEFYFGKTVDKLNLAESALLAGITQYPSKFDPIKNPDAALEKRNLVLDKMLELGFISSLDYDNATAAKIGIKADIVASRQSYFTDQVVIDVLDVLKNEKGMTEQDANTLLYSGGLKIYSTIDPDVQKAMNNVFTNDANFPTVKAGAAIPQAAMMVTDPTTGAVKGIVGGRGEKTANLILNRATQSTRQPGSSMKPIGVYAPGVELGLIKPTTIYEDKAINIGGYKPGNWYSGYRGSVTVRYAIEYSINTVAVQVMNDVGVEYCYNFLKNKLHFNSLTANDKNLALALGGVDIGVTVAEMTAGYASFANNGTYIEPYTFTKILDNNGKAIYENKIQRTTAMKKETAKTMNSMLRSTVTSGLASSANFSSSYDICGKTGTTDDSKDRWFVGYTPYYAGGVWFGYDQPATLNFSGNPALNLWKKVMTEIHKNLPAKRFDLSGVPSAPNPESSSSPTPSGEDVQEEPLPSGTVLPSQSPTPDASPEPSVNPSVKPTDTETQAEPSPIHSQMLGL